MDGFQTQENEPMDDYHFWIKGRYNDVEDEFYFYVKINPKLSGTETGQFFKELKKQLEKRRSLTETEMLIEDMKTNRNERVQELGQIITLAADKAWAEHFIKSSLS
jgi:hypothetical protein